MSRFMQQGQRLRERREALGLTHEDVYQAIHVPITHLRALESGDGRRMPVSAYARGFLRSYCEFLRLDPEPFLSAYDWSAPAARAAATPRPADPGPDDGRPAWLTDVIAWGAVCLLLLLGWFSYSVVFRPAVEDADVRVEAGGAVLESMEFFPLDFSERP